MIYSRILVPVLGFVLCTGCGPTATEKALDDALKARKAKEEAGPASAQEADPKTGHGISAGQAAEKKTGCSPASLPQQPMSDALLASKVKEAAANGNLKPGVSARGVKLGMTVEEAIAILGVEPADRTDKSVRFHKLFSADLHNGKISLFSLFRTFGPDDPLSPEGISVATTRQQVLGILGEPDGEDGYGLYYAKRGLTVTLDADRLVDGFRVYPPYTPATFAIEPGIGVGPARIGGSCEEAVAIIPGPVSPWNMGSTSFRMYRSTASRDVSVVCDLEGKTVKYIELYAPYGGVTKGGLGVGSTVKDWEAAGYSSSTGGNPQEPIDKGIFLWNQCPAPERIAKLRLLPSK